MKVPNHDAQKAASIEMIAWLHQVWELMQAGRQMQPDPFYERNEKLTPAVVVDVLGWFESLFEREARLYPGYHYPAQGVARGEAKLVPPKFLNLSPSQQLAIVQGVDRIAQSYRVEDAPQ